MSEQIEVDLELDGVMVHAATAYPPKRPTRRMQEVRPGNGPPRNAVRTGGPEHGASQKWMP